MTVRVVSIPLELKPLLRISPSRYSALQACALREIWAAGQQQPLLPNSPSARLGMIIHKLLQLAFSGKLIDENSMLNHWDEEERNQEQQMQINSLEKHLIPISNYSNNYKTKQSMTFNMIRPLIITNQKHMYTTLKSQTELWVQTVDAKVGGRIDLVRHNDEGVTICDYKSGEIIESELTGDIIKKEYQNQLKIYAALYYLSNNIWPDRLLLIGLNQDEYEVPFVKEECLILVEKAKEYLNELNERILSGKREDTFACPSPENCKFCQYRPACVRYWGSKQDQNGWPTDFEGTVVMKNFLGNGLLKVALKNDDVDIIIRGLSPERYPFLNDGFIEVMFCNLQKETVQGCFKETHLTTGYGLYS